MAIKHLVFQFAEEVLDRSVVQAIAFSGHGLDDALVVQGLVPWLHLILPALVRVENETFKIFKPGEGFIQ